MIGNTARSHLGNDLPWLEHVSSSVRKMGEPQGFFCSWPRHRNDHFPCDWSCCQHGILHVLHQGDCKHYESGKHQTWIGCGLDFDLLYVADVGLRLYAPDGATDGATSCIEVSSNKNRQTMDAQG
ncbi:unnamed protein product [Durusdinium trenchii]|uniref:Uncharacterized protein n=1 Tax=Durusdinium trenchii TaxID=1381693 RepID=A0ABP0P7F1_9DINO